MRKLNIHSLKISINNLCDFLDKEYTINRGGCCLIASIIAKHLEQLNISYELVIFDQIKKDKEAIQTEVLNKIRNKKSFKSVTGYHTCNHYCIKIIGAGLINSDDMNCTYKYTIKNITYKNIKWIYKAGDWNDEYDISNNSIIKNIFNDFFKKYEL